MHAQGAAGPLGRRAGRLRRIPGPNARIELRGLPLSCNGAANTVSVNEYCLLDDPGEAFRRAVRFSRAQLAARGHGEDVRYVARLDLLDAVVVLRTDGSLAPPENIHGEVGPSA